MLAVLLLLLSKGAIGYTRLNLPQRSTICKILQSTSSTIDSVLNEASLSSEKLSVQAAFKSLTQQEDFISKYWQKKPLLVKGPLTNMQQSFVMADVQQAVDEDFLEAGRGSFQEGETGWNMATVSVPRGKSFEEAKLRYEDITMAMKQTSGTVVFNSAGGFIPSLAIVCLETVNAFQLPNAINVYLTNPHQQTSAPPHTDKQDVFVLQTQGYKHWRVFAPPAPSRNPRSDPFARGKGSDVLTLNELDTEPLIDTVLSPGQLLYIPAGYPHTTDTVHIPDHSEPSVHLTVGIDSIIWGFTYAQLRSMCLQLAGLADDSQQMTRLPTDLYFRLQSTLPVGFLSKPLLQGLEGQPSSALRGELYQTMTDSLLQLMREIDTDLFPSSYSDEQLKQDLQIEKAIDQVLAHYMTITDIFGEMYYDVGNKISPAKMNLSFFRSQPYFQQLEQTMEAFVQWPKLLPKTKIASQRAIATTTTAIPAKAADDVSSKVDALLSKGKAAGKRGFAIPK